MPIDELLGIRVVVETESWVCTDFEGLMGEALPEGVSSCPLPVSLELRRLAPGRFSREVCFANDEAVGAVGGIGRLRRDGGITPPPSAIRTNGSRNFSRFGSARDDIGASRWARCEPAVLCLSADIPPRAPNSLTPGRPRSAMLEVFVMVREVACELALLLVVIAGGGIPPGPVGEGTLGRFAIRGILVGVAEGMSRD